MAKKKKASGRARAEPKPRRPKGAIRFDRFVISIGQIGDVHTKYLVDLVERVRRALVNELGPELVVQVLKDNQEVIRPQSDALEEVSIPKRARFSIRKHLSDAGWTHKKEAAIKPPKAALSDTTKKAKVSIIRSGTQAVWVHKKEAAIKPPNVLAHSSTGIFGRFFVRDFQAATPRSESIDPAFPSRPWPSLASAAVAA